MLSRLPNKFFKELARELADKNSFRERSKTLDFRKKQELARRAVNTDDEFLMTSLERMGFIRECQAVIKKYKELMGP